jgi:Stage II sporulation protein E (SpoIIE)
MYHAGMRFSLHCFALAMLFVPGIAARAQEAPPVTVLKNFGRGVASFDGPWQFHPGDNPAWAAPGIDDATGHDGWEEIMATAPWGAQGHRSYTGYAWYRIHLEITPAHGIADDYTLMAPRLESTSEIYWNGALVARSGKMPPYPSWSYDDPLVEGDEAQQVFHLGALGSGVLAVRVWFRPLWSYDDGLQGGFYKAPILGTPPVIAQYTAALKFAQLRGDQYAYALQAVYAMVMLLGFIGWMRDRTQRALLWMAVFSMGVVAMALLGFFQTSVSFQNGYCWAQIWLSIRDIGLWYLLIYLLELDGNRRLMRFTAILTAIDFSAGVADGVIVYFDQGNPALARILQIADAFLTVPLVSPSLYPLVLVVLAARKRLDAPRWTVAIFAFAAGLLSDAVIILQQGRRYTHWTIADRISAPLFTIAGNPFNAETLAGTGLFLAILYALTSYVIEHGRRQGAIALEMRNAREVQQVLVPLEVPSIPGFKIESVYIPAGEVGGDFFQILPAPNDGVLAVIGDVSGKGMPAAMTVSLLVGTVRTLAHYTQSPAEILAAMNHRMLNRSNGGFTTCLVLRIDRDGKLTAGNAGHLSPYRNGEEIALENGLPLGLAGQAKYVETALQLNPGDTLTLISDGVLEARNASGELFGFDRTQSISTEPAEKIAEAARVFGQEDDITVLTLTMMPAAETVLSS